MSGGDVEASLWLLKPPEVVSDIHRARAHLVERGVEVSEIQVAGRSGFRPSREGGGLDNVGFVFFSDPDDNGWAVPPIATRG